MVVAVGVCGDQVAGFPHASKWALSISSVNLVARLYEEKRILYMILAVNMLTSTGVCYMHNLNQNNKVNELVGVSAPHTCMHESPCGLCPFVPPTFVVRYR